jgi:hypothetical protein
MQKAIYSDLSYPICLSPFASILPVCKQYGYNHYSNWARMSTLFFAELGSTM